MLGVDDGFHRFPAYLFFIVSTIVFQSVTDITHRLDLHDRSGGWNLDWKRDLESFL